MNLFKRSKQQEAVTTKSGGPIDDLDRQVTVIYNMFVGIIGAERVILRAGKYEAMPFIHSNDPRQRLIGMQRIIFESMEYEEPPATEDIPAVLTSLEEELADLLARQAVEDRLERLINEKLDEKHQEYVRELKLQIIKEELKDIETPQTKEKLEQLKALDGIALTKSVMELVRPRNTAEIIGQEEAVDAMISKLATPYPQHMILYGPPGVGKTTAARLVLEEARRRGYTPFGETAPFVETAGTTLRWDSRDITNPLIGSVHDPIYQGAGPLGVAGIPQPKAGAVTKAHGGVLFIDEIDCSFHFALSEQIVAKLKELPNTQVILTTHNTNLLSNELIRPDCAYVIDGSKIKSLKKATNNSQFKLHILLLSATS